MGRGEREKEMCMIYQRDGNMSDMVMFVRERENSACTCSKNYYMIMLFFN